MGVQTAITLDEYLHTSYPNPDREFRDGELIERSMPDSLHGECQGLFCVFFGQFRNKLRLYACPETRLRLPNNRVLIPDISVFHPSKPARVPDSPPLVVIEILSRDDLPGAVREKLQEYIDWGVPHVWLVDPDSRRLYSFDKELIEVESLKIAELGIEVRPDDIFDPELNTVT